MNWLKAEAKANIGEIYIYGEITDFKFFEEDVTPTDIRKELDKLKDVDAINVYVNSPGGGVFAGLAIYNELKRINKPTTAFIDGIAASISSLIVLGCDRVVMSENSMYMIHRVWTVACGNATDLHDVADKIANIDDKIMIPEYDRKTGLGAEELGKMMEVETWMTGEEAVEMGFADEIVEGQKIAACYKGDNIAFNNVEIALDRFKSFPKNKFKEHKNKTGMTLQQRHKHTMHMLEA